MKRDSFLSEIPTTGTSGAYLELLSVYDRLTRITIHSFAEKVYQMSFGDTSAKIMIASALCLCAVCCGSPKRISRLNKDDLSARIELGTDNAVTAPKEEKTRRDTIVIRNIDGRQMMVMRAIKDENGQMVANQVLEAAHVTARFRNVAERHGRIDLMFQIHVPAALQESRWQLRYEPTMFIMGDSVHLEKVMITGREYRRRQLRGYQQYQRFLDRIITDSTKLIHLGELEVFLRRNLPEVYAFRNDSSFVTDEAFESAFGVSQKEAVDHYTDKLASSMNRRRAMKKDKMFRRYVKAPITSEGIRLDTVLTNADGDYIYNYVQTIRTRPKLKKVDIVMDGEIFEQDRKLCDIGRSKALNFYISSVSAFVDESPRYLTRIIERNAECNSSYDIDFKTGKADIEPLLGSNSLKINEIKSNLSSLVTNSTFQLDSITVTASASPEGSRKANAILSGRRSESICRYFSQYIRSVEDSLRREEGFSIDLSGGEASKGRKDKQQRISFKSRHIGEDWATLDALVETDSTLSAQSKKEYKDIAARYADADAREREMSHRSWYRDIRERLYPELRSVDFAFHLHRRGMLKDTIHTTVLDSVYMAGVEAIKDRDYDRAIELLRPYNDYNTAVAYCAKDFNYSALSILKDCPKTAMVNYMLALLSARLGDSRQAVEYYVQSCDQDPKYIHRGNLDPEISALIREYGLASVIQPDTGDDGLPY